jgi:hypothetical protein
MLVSIVSYPWSSNLSEPLARRSIVKVIKSRSYTRNQIKIQSTRKGKEPICHSIYDMPDKIECIWNQKGIAACATQWNPWCQRCWRCAALGAHPSPHRFITSRKQEIIYMFSIYLKVKLKEQDRLILLFVINLWRSNQNRCSLCSYFIEWEHRTHTRGSAFPEILLACLITV